ncbi:MAG: DNA strand exchange inhibitor protein [Phycisphaerae bacterium]|jgi:DNA mismatch repair protein MutS2
MDAHALECLDFPSVRALLARHAMTGLGRSLAQQIRPIGRPQMVQRWLDQVIELQRYVEQHGLPPFGGVTDVREIVRRCAPPLRVSVEEMARVGDALAATRDLTRYLHDLPEDSPELKHVAGRIGDFDSIATRVRAIVDPRGQVRDDASPKLQRIRTQIDEATRQIGTTVERLLREPTVRRLLQYANPTFHNDRIVLPLRTEYRGRLPGIIHRTSDSGATVYVEPAQVVELNNQISNLRIAEKEECDRLLWELAHEVHLNGEEILRTLDTMAVLDLIVAKVRFARAYELRCPALSTDGLLDVRQARHPLLVDLQHQHREAGEPISEIVPIDYRLGSDFDLLIVTGPNTGGKTVTLKTVGLINLMVQAGIPVPVGPGSTVGLYNDVLIDIGDEQSMQQSLSTFSAHLKRLLEMLQKANRKTLMLIDELGAGTDPDEGAALGRAMLDELLRLQTRCIVTTHLGALKAYALTRPRAENASVEFDNETLRPTYHLRIGEPGASCAIDVAQRLGMPRRLAVAARNNLSRQARQLGAALRGTAQAKREAEQARRAAQDAELDAQRARGEAHDARSRLEQKQAEFQHWVQRVVHLQPGDPVRVRNFDRDGRVLRVRLDQQRAEVDVGAFAVEVPLGDVLPPETTAPPPRLPASAPARSAAPRNNPPRRQPAARSDRPVAVPPRKQQRSAPPRPEPQTLTEAEAEALAPGEIVYVKRFHRTGQVVRSKPSKKMIVVSMGLLEIEVPYDGLAHEYAPRGARPKRPRPPRKPDEPTPPAE